MGPNNPLAKKFRHSREGGNPARIDIPHSGQYCYAAPLRGGFLINWIPAFAGMTA
jgi:hypothetical protein